MKVFCRTFIASSLLLCSENIALSQTDYWLQVSRPVGSTVYSLAINPQDHIFAATNGNKVARSTDNGRSWTQVGAGLTNPVVLALGISSLGQSRGNIFAGTSGVYRSSNGGESWTQLNSSLADVVVFSFAFNSAGDIFVGTGGSGILRSTDNGINWTQINADPLSSSVHCLAVNSAGYIFAGTNNNILRSTDNGASWARFETALTNVSVRALAVNSRDFLFAGTAGGGVFRSIDNGENWIQVHVGLTSLDVRSLVINTNDDVFAGTNGGGVFLSTSDGERWIPINTGMTGKRIWALALNSRGYIFAAELGGIIFRSVRSTTGYEEEVVEIPSAYALEQNYPNPFNSGTTIEFSLPRTSNVSLKVYNLLGQEVTTLVQEVLRAGRHKTRWEADGSTTGVYFYRFEAKAGVLEDEVSYAETKKLVLLK